MYSTEVHLSQVISRSVGITCLLQLVRLRRGGRTELRGQDRVHILSRRNSLSKLYECFASKEADSPLVRHGFWSVM